MTSSDTTEENFIVQREFTLRFHGNGAEYFRIWIVNLALSFLTLGIYSPWAKVRALKYLYGSTELDGSRFGYHADPKVILKGRAIAALLFVPFLVLVQMGEPAAFAILLVAILLMPWMVARSLRYRLRMTSWRNIRFGWRGKGWQWYLFVLASLFFLIITFGIAYPARHQAAKRLAIGETRFGTWEFSVGKATGEFYGIYFMVGFTMAVCIAIITGLIAMLGVLEGAYFESVPSIATSMLTVLVYFTGAKVLGAMTTRALVNKTVVGSYRLKGDVLGAAYTLLCLKNFVLLVLTLGLYWPWAKTSEMAFRIDRMSLIGRDFEAEEITLLEADAGAVGEEIADWFDFDVAF